MPEAARPRPILCLVVDRRVSRQPLTEAVLGAARAGVDWLQLRERELEGAAWLDWAQELVEAGRSAHPSLRIIVNRRIDIALAIGADGAHLGFDALEPCEARGLLGDSALIGVSAHTADEVAAAAGAGVSYAHLAPIFDPHSKPASRPALGPGTLREAAQHGVPLLAQGGIDAERARSSLAAGAAGVAVTGAILMADDPAQATAELREALDGGGASAR